MPKKTYGAEEARSKLPELLERAHRGLPTVITKRGEPYAALVPVKDVRVQSKHASSFMGLRSSGRGLWGSDTRAMLAELRDEWE
jgi:prevent-host-death family protein